MVLEKEIVGGKVRQQMNHGHLVMTWVLRQARQKITETHEKEKCYIRSRVYLKQGGHPRKITTQRESEIGI